MPTYTTLIRGKGVFDDCKTIKGMIKNLDALKKGLEEYDKAGLTVRGAPIYDDYAWLFTENKAVAKRFSMHEEEE